MNIASTIKLLDLYPSSGTYHPGEEVTLCLIAESDTEYQQEFRAVIYHGPDVADILTQKQLVQVGRQKITFHWQPPANSPAGYGVQLVLVGGAAEDSLETAFDVLQSWTNFPRYGFLCDFFPTRAEEEKTIESLAKYHINGLQFYDWQYRHDQLVPPTDDFLDPLGRSLSLNRIRTLIAAAHRHGIAAMPYLTIYAASASFWRSHPEWMLYDPDKKPIPFGDDFLGIMNPAKGSAWHDHLLRECASVLSALPFDGLHIDQFGEPKTAFDASGLAVDLPQAFHDFIADAAAQHPDAPILFNAVGNWPIETLATSATSFNYIEIWPPDVSYSDVVRIVRNARELSSDKPVTIALYIPASQELNNLRANALIISAGGTRIEIGEEDRLLSDPYFPKHEEMTPELKAALRKQYDLIIRYEEWFGPLVNETTPISIKIPAGIEAFYRQGNHKASLSLVNLNSETPLTWNTENPDLIPYDEFDIEVALPNRPNRVLWVDIDGSTLTPSHLENQYKDGFCTIRIPRLSLWTVLLFEF